MTPTNIDEITLKCLTMDQGSVLNSDFHNEKKKSQIHSMCEIQNALLSVMSIIIKAIY